MHCVFLTIARASDGTVGRRVRIWTGDIELHITGNVAYAVREYIRAAGDKSFFLECGCEIIQETARFWASRLEYDAGRDRYEIRGVIGPASGQWALTPRI